TPTFGTFRSVLACVCGKRRHHRRFGHILVTFEYKKARIRRDPSRFVGSLSGFAAAGNQRSHHRVVYLPSADAAKVSDMAFNAGGKSGTQVERRTPDRGVGAADPGTATAAQWSVKYSTLKQLRKPAPRLAGSSINGSTGQ